MPGLWGFFHASRRNRDLRSSGASQICRTATDSWLGRLKVFPGLTIRWPERGSRVPRLFFLSVAPPSFRPFLTVSPPRRQFSSLQLLRCLLFNARLSRRPSMVMRTWEEPSLAFPARCSRSCPKTTSVRVSFGFGKPTCNLKVGLSWRVSTRE